MSQPQACQSDIHSLPALCLENEVALVSILPDPGAKIHDITVKGSGQQILWQNPRIFPQRYPIESNFDNYWCGGWDEGFPTCDPCEYKGELYPNLGELRSLAWRVDDLHVAGDTASAALFAYGPISPVRAYKRVSLRGATVTVDYELSNIGVLPIEFIWGSHPALAVNDKTIFHIPAQNGIVQLSSAPGLGVPGQKYSWPILEAGAGVTDMSRVQPMSAAVYCGQYATDLRTGAYGIEFAGEDLGLIFRFDRAHCPLLWMWLVYGGWRGYHHAIIEPWTSCPVHLADAVRQNTHKTLQAGETFATRVSLSICSGLERWREQMRAMDLL
jgi:galactose mutarotase-like enzyme